MSFTFRPAVRENVGLLIGLAGGTGSGKTFSAMRLAAGIASGKPFAVIDTEAGRAKHYADKFRFDHGDLRAPFSPDAYADAIKAADDAKYSVIVVDSASHEHAGDGGLLDWHDAELDRMAGDDWKKREACKMAAWIKPKMAHKAMVNKLLQVRAHIILCFRAEEKNEVTSDRKLLEEELLRNSLGPTPQDEREAAHAAEIRADLERRVSQADKKMRVIPKRSRTGRDGWVPICEKNLPFEMTCSFLLLSDDPGVPNPIKLPEMLRPMFPSGKPIDESAGRAMAAWAAGGAVPSAPEQSSTYRNRILEEAEEAAAGGTEVLKAFWNRIPADSKRSLEPHKDRLKSVASAADAER